MDKDTLPWSLYKSQNPPVPGVLLPGSNCAQKNSLYNSITMDIRFHFVDGCSCPKNVTKAKLETEPLDMCKCWRGVEEFRKGEGIKRVGWERY